MKVDKSKFPDVKTSKDIDQLAEKLVSEMTLEEKIDQFYGEKAISGWNKFVMNLLVNKVFPRIYVGRNERLNIPPFVLSDGPRGARVKSKELQGVTAFPVAIARGASWDVDLESRVHDIIAKEMRANGTNYAATPCINVLRHPGWGRAQETYGEDPWHIGVFGVAATQAIQQHNVMACPKHFALNSIENSRFYVDVDVDERTLREVYLPHFKKVVQQGNAASMMSAYNKVRGEYMSDNTYLLNDILRDEWGFTGFVSSDWVMGTHDAAKSIKAGMDIEMPMQNHMSYIKIKDGLADGSISMQDIDRNALRILKTRLPYAFADDKVNYSINTIANPEHIAVALEAAEKSIVLLKNNDVLPFNLVSGKKIAVIGRLADVANTGDHGSSDSPSSYVVTPFEGIKKLHAALGNEVMLSDGEDLQAAVDMAKTADEVIIIVGYAAEEEGEHILIGDQDQIRKSAEAGKLIGNPGIGGDREDLKLRNQDEALIKAISAIQPNSTVVYVGGSAIDMSNWNEDAHAIVFAWYGGMEGGTALANVLYGKVNPSGKLPFTIAKRQEDYPPFKSYTLSIDYGYYHGYSLFEKQKKEIAYPFGFGLSYTSFAFDSLEVQNKVSEDSSIIVKVRVANTGNRSGSEVAQVYIGFKNSTVDRPFKLLRGFEKVTLDINQAKIVEFRIPIEELAWYNPDTKRWEIEAMNYEVYVGNSSDTAGLLTGEFDLIQ
uniref:beta-glucosidase n=1 Tax=Fulvivirga sp. TaxID=1931237 RepID=UPI00404AA107